MQGGRWAERARQRERELGWRVGRCGCSKSIQAESSLYISLTACSSSALAVASPTLQPGKVSEYYSSLLHSIPRTDALSRLLGTYGSGVAGLVHYVCDHLLYSLSFPMGQRAQHLRDLLHKPVSDIRETSNQAPK